VKPPEEWWLAADAGAGPAIVDTLSHPPAGGTTVISLAGRSRALSSDPVALGSIGALGIGFVAAAIFAVIGFVVSAAVSARERVAEFALLRALGLSTGQLSVWLSLENTVLAAFSLISGTLLGLGIAWVVMPFITVTQGAATPYPPVEVAVPWSVIGLLEAAGAIALGATVVALAWSLPRIGLGSVLRMSED
jgi:ABC-type antimicrobial peptide transport system permease subunit